MSIPGADTAAGPPTPGLSAPHAPETTQLGSWRSSPTLHHYDFTPCLGKAAVQHPYRLRVLEPRYSCSRPITSLSSQGDAVRNRCSARADAGTVSARFSALRRSWDCPAGPAGIDDSRGKDWRKIGVKVLKGLVNPLKVCRIHRVRKLPYHTNCRCNTRWRNGNRSDRAKPLDLGTVTVNIQVGDRHGHQFEEFDIIVDTGSTYTSTSGHARTTGSAHPTVNAITDRTRQDRPKTSAKPS